MQERLWSAPVENVVGLMRAGLLHGRRQCEFCNAWLELREHKADLLNFAWRCQACHASKKLLAHTFLDKMNVHILQIKVKLWLMAVSPDMCNDLTGHMCSADIFKLYRKATSLFSKARLISRLVLPGPVEVDDFMIGMNDQDSSLKKRWVLQLYDRTLNAPLLFFLRSDHDYRNIPAYLQKHIEHTRYPAAVFTDNKPSYVFESLKKNRRISRLNCRGFLHFFKQVEEQQCHKAFPFVSLQNVKNTWPAIKYAFPYALHFSMKPGICQLLHALPTR